MSDNLDGLEERLRQRETLLRHPLHTAPRADVKTNGHLPNTPLTASLISFLLGSIFSLGLLLFLTGGVQTYWWATYQLGFFVAAWAAFHWGEFAVTAGWNLEKCSVDSFLLDNGSMYHIANGSAVVEYLVTLYFKPEFKSHTWVSVIGIVMVLVGQALRSTAMIHASTNFSHTVASQKRQMHRLVTDGVYAYVAFSVRDVLADALTVGSVTRLTPDSITGQLVLNSFYKTLYALFFSSACYGDFSIIGPERKRAI
ncbi:hypothetical protein D9758_008859 [Tetrapyrgos nigripes]|uniref:Protein-S-isoprenylcysteine O-methyltransferase n=1 Tax=Tetrapyrgos nigripes TaxID=182062 RepID=A0A8H5FPI3_9AGAR|nr:hypothetical protein D9758_008859 [Tetrapyrgos nigripes]